MEDELYAIFEDIEKNMGDMELLRAIKVPDVVEGVDTQKS